MTTTDRTITLRIHLEGVADDRKVVWWADSEDVPGFSAAADCLADLRSRVTEALDSEIGSGYRIVEVLDVGPGEGSGGPEDHASAARSVLVSS